MGSVRTSIIGRLLPLPRGDVPRQALHAICDEPHCVSDSVPAGLSPMTTQKMARRRPASRLCNLQVPQCATVAD